MPDSGVSVQKPLVIPVFIPHSGCPHQCAFCNQHLITNQKGTLPDQNAVHKIITRYSGYKRGRGTTELAFYGGNFLGLSKQHILDLLELITPYIKENRINGIRFSTRPDTITRETLDLIAPYPIAAVELGVQSMNDAVLLASKRGHTAQDTVNAMDLLKKYAHKIGVQMMVGMPRDTETSLLESTRELAGLSPDFARIYPLMVLKGSLMEQWYKQGKYLPLSLEESVRIVKQIYRILTASHINVIRMGLQASEITRDDSFFLAGPWHPAFGHLVFSELMYDKICDKLEKSEDFKNAKALTLAVHPKSRSRVGGDQNKNIKRLARCYPDITFSIIEKETVREGEVDIKRL